MILFHHNSSSITHSSQMPLFCRTSFHNRIGWGQKSPSPARIRQEDRRVMIGVTARARPGALGSRGAHRGAAGGRSPRTPRRVDALDARPTFAAGRGVSVRRGDPRGGVSEERGRCRGAPGVATAAVPIAGGATSIPQQLWCNPIFRTGFIGWFSAQVLKVSDPEPVSRFPVCEMK